ncbi:hypothetical protein COB21_02895 [Candidatus Aerophobetes bacterium]|uniref:Uncharacterized protein n=1 Tax=Aerophobetes bacterium TaxID=2030807 RepID=A0A2A4X5H5_UNCAE|nr:MAG: hypothetical protein COB21_02895 [Candidatus Aerophobetes bacterium]
MSVKITQEIAQFGVSAIAIAGGETINTGVKSVAHMALIPPNVEDQTLSLEGRVSPHSVRLSPLPLAEDVVFEDDDESIESIDSQRLPLKRKLEASAVAIRKATSEEDGADFKRAKFPQYFIPALSRQALDSDLIILNAKASPYKNMHTNPLAMLRRKFKQSIKI